MVARVLMDHDDTPVEAKIIHGDAYEDVSTSIVLPGIDLAELASYLDRPTASQAIREYRAALQRS